LYFGRVPAGTQRHGDAEAGARHTQQQGHLQQVVVAVHEEVAEGHGQRDQAQLDQGGGLAAHVLGQQAQRETHDGAGHDGDGQQQALLRRCEVELFADEGRHGAVHHPDDEREHQVEERGEQRGRVPTLKERSESGHGVGLVGVSRGKGSP
jgi:hypothetical protein